MQLEPSEKQGEVGQCLDLGDKGNDPEGPTGEGKERSGRPYRGRKREATELGRGKDRD